jgi:hypothetical protein
MYGLRHFFVQQALSSGAPLHGVSRWAGHSRVELTAKTYGDFAPDNADPWDWADVDRGERTDFRVLKLCFESA